MSRLLDTDTCIALLRNSSAIARKHLEELTDVGESPSLSVITLHELWLGVIGSRWRSAGETELEALIGTLPVLAFEPADARAAAEVRQVLRQRGTPIGAYDTLLAGQAVARGLKLVTGNLREFKRVEGLQTESWFE